MPIRHRLLVSAATAALGIPVALAAEEGAFKFDVGGFLDGGLFRIDQDARGSSEDRDFDALVNGELHLRGRYITDEGVELGGRVELRLQSGERSDSTSGADDALALDKAYLWAESGLGRLEIGAQDGAAKQLQVEPPSVTKSMRIDHPLMMPVTDADDAYYRPGGLMLRTDPYASDQSLKIVYRSPRLFGLQLGVSYTPEFSANLERFVKRAGDDTDQQSDIFEVGLNYDSTIDTVRLRASLVYLMADNERPSITSASPLAPWRSGDLSEWGAAASVKYEGFTLGGAYRHSNAQGGFIDHAPVVLTGGASDTDIWSIGALYEFESWKLGANYAYGDTNVAVAGLLGGRVEAQDGHAWQIAAAYAVDSNIQIAAGYQRYGFDASAGLNPFGLSQTRPTGLAGGRYVGDLDADILFTEISLGF